MSKLSTTVILAAFAIAYVASVPINFRSLLDNVKLLDFNNNRHGHTNQMKLTESKAQSGQPSVTAMKPTASSLTASSPAASSPAASPPAGTGGGLGTKLLRLAFQILSALLSASNMTQFLPLLGLPSTRSTGTIDWFALLDAGLDVVTHMKLI